MPRRRNNLQINLRNQRPAAAGARAARRNRRNAARARTLKEKRKAIADARMEKITEQRVRYGNPWKMRKDAIEAKFIALRL